MQIIHTKPEVRYDTVYDKLRWEMKYAYLACDMIQDGWITGESEADCFHRLESVKEGIKSMENQSCKI